MECYHVFFHGWRGRRLIFRQQSAQKNVGLRKAIAIETKNEKISIDLKIFLRGIWFRCRVSFKTGRESSLKLCSLAPSVMLSTLGWITRSTLGGNCTGELKKTVGSLEAKFGEEDFSLRFLLEMLNM